MTSSMTGYRGPTGMSPRTTATGSFKEKIPSGFKAGTLQQFSPEQMQLFSQLFSHTGPDSYLSRLASGDQSMFEEMEAPAYRQFAGSLGQIASKFSQPGTGARKSSGFQNTATSAASNFAQDLASRRQELQRQALMDLMGISNNLLAQRPYERFLTEKPQSFLQSLGSGLSTGLGQGLGKSIGGGFSNFDFNNFLPLIGGAI